MKVTAEKKNRQYRVIFNYPDLTEKEALARATAEITDLTKNKRPWGWTFKVKT